MVLMQSWLNKTKNLPAEPAAGVAEKEVNKTQTKHRPGNVEDEPAGEICFLVIPLLL